MADEDQKPEQGSEAETEASESAEVTPDSGETQEEEATDAAEAGAEAGSEGGAATGPAKPAAPKAAKNSWIKPQPVEFATVDEACEDHVQQLSKNQTICESLMLQYVLGETIHKEYYNSWRSNANRYFRAIVNVRLRQRQNAAAAAGAAVTADEGSSPADEVAPTDEGGEDRGDDTVKAEDAAS